MPPSQPPADGIGAVPNIGVENGVHGEADEDANSHKRGGQSQDAIVKEQGEEAEEHHSDGDGDFSQAVEQLGAEPDGRLAHPVILDRKRLHAKRTVIPESARSPAFGSGIALPDVTVKLVPLIWLGIRRAPPESDRSTSESANWLVPACKV